ncbi:DUF3226 domain-containing protein [uncultured Rhodospira sp.]|uniref:DUF3226 domain-containing protein n=1 Tax=uncultured Rhodospira sp. TaxID=1936189 RepID=UPI002637CC73|nr:DUF3226 domain-containing protein [uncultured Rhodospira sp.]
MNDNSNVLLVEGNDDQHVFWNLFEAHSIPVSFSVEKCGSDSGVLRDLGVRLKGSTTQAIGVILDADVSPEGRWISIKDVLRKHDYPEIPDEPQSHGAVVLREGKPRIGIWLMPDNVTQGMLEDFVCLLIPDGDELFNYARTCINGMSNDLRLFKDAHQSKAEIHTWLAWQEDPGTPMGLAIRKKYLNPDRGKVPDFLKWVERVFLTEGTNHSA